MGPFLLLLAAQAASAIPIASTAGAGGARAAPYVVGAGIFDITMTPADIILFGYAATDQNAAGLQSRQFARVFLFGEDEDSLVLYGVSDSGELPLNVKLAVVAKLEAQFPGRFNEANVMLSATHTHGTPGGLDNAFLYSLIIGGFVEQNFDAIVDGFVQATARALANLQPGNVHVAETEVSDATQNRSRPQYLGNPRGERDEYNRDIDPTMLVLAVDTADGKRLGVINWFAMHPTSMKKTNRLVTGDNKGFASYVLEKASGRSYLDDDAFVAAFPTSNTGDTSPNLGGPDYQLLHENKGYGFAPFPSRTPDYHRTMTESMMWSGGRLAEATNEVLEADMTPVSGSIAVRHTYVDMRNVTVRPEFADGQERRTCEAALGYSFAAGTTDGISLVPGFYQGQLEGVDAWDRLASIVHGELSPELIECHAPKPILLAIGSPFWGIPMTPPIIPLQIFKIGRVAIVGFPAEITTMAGRRLRETVLEAFAGEVDYVAINGYANCFTGYVTTKEEYDQQWYEAGSSHFGPWSLNAFQQEFSSLAAAIVDGRPIGTGPDPLEFRTTDHPSNNWPADATPNGEPFGTVVDDVDAAYPPGDRAQVSFWGATPRNNLRTMDTYLVVERIVSENETEVVARDFDFETHFHWSRPDGRRDDSSLVTIEWFIPAGAAPGSYQITYFGDAKAEDDTVAPFVGKSAVFSVDPSAPMSTKGKAPYITEFPHLLENGEVDPKKEAEDFENLLKKIMTSEGPPGV